MYRSRILSISPPRALKDLEYRISCQCNIQVKILYYAKQHTPKYSYLYFPDTIRLGRH